MKQALDLIYFWQTRFCAYSKIIVKEILKWLDCFTEWNIDIFVKVIHMLIRVFFYNQDEIIA